MRWSSALASAPTTSPPPPIPITSGRRAARRSASASVAIGRSQADRGVDLVVVAHDPAVAAVAQDALEDRLSGRAELDLDVELLGILAGQQLLLQRLPVGGVVDVVGDVALGGAKRPLAVTVGGFRAGMAQAGAHAPRGHAAVRVHLGLSHRRGAP